MAIKIWTNLYELAQADLVRNRKLYTIEIDACDYLPSTLEQWFEIDAEPSPRMAYVTVQSPEGFGPEHPIKINYPKLHYEDVLKTLIDRYATPCRWVENDISVLIGEKTDPYASWFARDSYGEVVSSIDSLEERLPVLKKYIAMYYDLQKGKKKN